MNRIEFLRNLSPYSFVVPEHVIAEVCDSQQSAALTVAMTNGIVTEVKLADASELSLYAELLRILGSGEAACLALAETRGWFLASDEKKLFLREASKRIGRSRILNTAGIFVKAIRLGLLTIDEADQDKRILKERRFIMKFNSFRDVL